MKSDAFGFIHTEGRLALDAFAEATLGVVTYRPQAGAALARAVAVDSLHLAAHALMGIGQVLQGRAELLPAARQAQSAAHAAASHGTTADEAALLEALDLALLGRQFAAADRLDARLAAHPEALLLVKLANMFRFMLGDVAGMQRSTARANLASDTPGYGYVLGCHAFALEEAGDYHDAESLGRRSLERTGDDVWAVHAVAHTYEMRARPRDGRRWMEEQRLVWTDRAGFGFHSAWHLAQFHLELGEIDRALQLYDTEIRPTPTLDGRDIANAVSLLWRLRDENVDVGSRWDELAALSRHRQADTTYVFFSLHYLLALLAVGDMPAASAMVAAISAESQGGRDQSHVARTVGAALAEALLGIASGRDGVVILGRLARMLEPLGGSHAQRDVFVRALACGAAQAGRQDILRDILAARRAMRAADRFDHALAAGPAAWVCPVSA
jgi:tetratricopeptide (TPR) repeat protein